MRKKSHERPNRIVEINWVQWKLNRVIDKTATDIHHIISRQQKAKFKVNENANLIRIPRRKHIALNNFYGMKQTPREQLREMYEIWKTALSRWVRQELYTILDLPDDMFYNEELLKWKKKKKNDTNTEKTSQNADTD
jgi:hypothetical protein